MKRRRACASDRDRRATKQFRATRHRVSVLRSLLLGLTAGVAACSQTNRVSSTSDPEWQRPGWHYSFPDNDDRGAAIFHFSDAPGDYFIALCDRAPTIALHRDGYDQLAKSFTLEIDGRRWELPIYSSAEGGLPRTDDSEIVRSFFDAKGNISYRVGNWKVHVPPNPALSRLIAECRKRNTHARP